MPRPADRVRSGYSSHRSPRFRVSFGVTRQRSRIYSPKTFSRLSILMNWLLLPEAVGVPSRKPASPFQPFSKLGAPPWKPTLDAIAAVFNDVMALPKSKDPRG